MFQMLANMLDFRVRQSPYYFMTKTVKRKQLNKIEYSESKVLNFMYLVQPKYFLFESNDFHVLGCQKKN